MRPSRIAIVAALALSIACERSGIPPTASEAALRVFELARERDPEPDALEALFVEVGDADRRAALYDALGRLGQASGVRVIAAEPLEGLDRTAVDLVGDMPGGGRANYSVHVETVGEGAWKVSWLIGPGVDWPPRRSGRGHGLSTSAPPGGPDPG